MPERVKGLRVGTHFHHSCPACRRDFSVASLGAIAFSLFAMTVLGGAGWLVVTHPPGSAAGAEGSNRWAGWVLVAFGAGAALIAVARARSRLVHRAVRTSGEP